MSKIRIVVVVDVNEKKPPKIDRYKPKIRRGDPNYSIRDILEKRCER